MTQDRPIDRPQSRLGAPSARRSRGTWRQTADVAARAAGPFPRPMVSAWRAELDAVEARVRILERAAPAPPEPGAALGEGVHALLALAGARLGISWSPPQLVAAAAAVELAYRATRHHRAVTDSGVQTRALNTQHVLDGDWSITEAALLVADIDPAAYRILVRGYGAVQLARLENGDAAAAVAMLPTAVALGAFVAGARDVEFPLSSGISAASKLLNWAHSLMPIDEPFGRVAAR